MVDWSFLFWFIEGMIAHKVDGVLDSSQTSRAVY